MQLNPLDAGPSWLGIGAAASPTFRYHRPDDTICDSPDREVPLHSGIWTVQWMYPEPMHAMEVVEMPSSAAGVPAGPSLLRVEIKCHR